VLGLVLVIERRRAGQLSLTNSVRVINQEWRTWLRLSDKGGVKILTTTGKDFSQHASERRNRAPFPPIVARWRPPDT
jgi:hypothetical protein